MITNNPERRDISILLLSCLFFYFGNLSAQSPYSLNTNKESCFLAGSAIVLGAGLYSFYQTESFSASDILTLNSSNINSFDRYAVGKYSSNVQRVSDGLLAASFLAPVPLIFEKQIQKDFQTLTVMYSEAFSLTVGTTFLIKSLTKRPRPFAYNPSVNVDEKTKRGARLSFFSGHTAITAMNSFFCAKVFNDYYPNSKFRPYVWTAAILLPAATGYARVEGGKHFPTDVIAGYAVGGLIGYFIPYFHKNKRRTKGNAFRISPQISGFSVQLTFR